MSRNGDITERKQEHLRICLEQNVESQHITTGFERYRFIHNALPEIDLSEVDLSCEFFGKRLSMPVVISPITGGTERAGRLNRVLAESAQEFGIAMSVGSQRIALERIDTESTFAVRNIAPDVLLFANIGAVQLNYGVTNDDCRRLVEMIQADALTLHLNPIHECMQENGDTNFTSLLSKIEQLCSSLEVPIAVKEVGFGISGECARRLSEVGVRAIDVAGTGGTNWAMLESYRSSDSTEGRLGRVFADWGLPTADCIEQVRQDAPAVQIIASGGIRTGVDIAKALALGANLAAIGSPFLKAAQESTGTITTDLTSLKTELATAMFGIGCKDIAHLSCTTALRHLCPVCQQCG